ncbi:hypothetical protein KUTeg_021001 [Tegillarca granosa]|uniref:Uncharacterized protein n=1 Tax=Tegillarca granosa TaxID=220873 RepID=A0ABQ9E9H9_TEGGR|nr:hypothetical protein KUTeg_021001 [Tegillarca granosa]
MENKEETKSSSLEQTTNDHLKAEIKEVFTIDDNEVEISNLSSQFSKNSPNSQSSDKQRGIIAAIKDQVHGLIRKHKSRIKVFIAVVFLFLYLAYVGYSLSYSFGDEGSWRLLIGTVFGFLLIIWKLLENTNAYKKMFLGCRNLKVPGKTKLIIKW